MKVLLFPEHFICSVGTSKTLVASSLLTITLIVLIIWRADVIAVAESAATAHLGYLLTAFVLSVLTLIVKVVRWRGLHEDLRDMPITRGLAYFTVGMYFSLMTILKAGDVFKVMLVKRKEGLKGAVAIMTVVVDRLLEMAALVILFGIGFFAYTNRVDIVPIPTELFLAVMITAILVISLLIVKSDWVLPFVRKADPVLRRFVGRFSSSNGAIDFEQLMRDFSDSFRKFLSDSRRLSWAVLLSILAWLLYVLQFIAIAAAFGLVIALDSWADWGSVCFIVAAAAIVSQLPLSIGGIGSRDLAYVVLLESLGYASAAVAAATLVQTLLGIVIPSIFGAFMVPRYLPREDDTSNSAKHSNASSDAIADVIAG